MSEAEAGVDGWTCRHFSQANPAGSGQDDLAALLRRIADTLDRLGPARIQDAVLHNEITADGPWWSMTVYYDASA